MSSREDVPEYNLPCSVQCVPEVQPDERDAEAAGSARHPRLLPVQGRRQVRQRRPRRTGQSHRAVAENVEINYRY